MNKKEIIRKIRGRDPDVWIFHDGFFGGTAYYYLVNNKVYYKFITNRYGDPITYGEVFVPLDLAEDGSLQLEVKGINGSCVAGGIRGSHLHILSLKRDYCSVAENIAYTGE